MSGYSGYSMSNNAIDAYENGEKPLSKWTKKEILNAVNEINPNIDLSKLNLKILKSKLLEKTSWHHTSKKYNKTDFYYINDEVKEWTQKDVDFLINEKQKENQLNARITQNIRPVSYTHLDVYKRQTCIRLVDLLLNHFNN